MTALLAILRRRQQLLRARRIAYFVALIGWLALAAYLTYTVVLAPPTHPPDGDAPIPRTTTEEVLRATSTTP